MLPGVLFMMKGKARCFNKAQWWNRIASSQESQQMGHLIFIIICQGGKAGFQSIEQ
jgi:hypothetical protein